MWLDCFTGAFSDTFIIFIYFSVCVCIYTILHVWSSKIISLSISFYHVGLVDQTQAIKLAGTILYPLSHLAGLKLLNFKNLEYLSEQDIERLSGPVSINNRLKRTKELGVRDITSYSYTWVALARHVATGMLADSLQPALRWKTLICSIYLFS